MPVLLCSNNPCSILIPTMLRINHTKSAAAAKSYYENGFAKSDYYSEDFESVGTWGGTAAKWFGLSGEVDPKDFSSLVDNLHPETHERITVRQRANRRIGYDFTFSVPKSVSLLAEVMNDREVVVAFDQALKATMSELEADMMTRVRVDGKNEDRFTGNLVYASFDHHTTRPIGGLPDPHLHAHAFVFNLTYDQVENRYKAGEFSNIKSSASYYEAAFDARLAERLEEMGYEIERRGKTWEVAGIDKKTLKRFSRRTKEIEEAAKARNIKDPKVKAKLGVLTRQAKGEESLSRQELQDLWQALIPEQELKQLKNTYQKAQSRHISGMPEINQKVKEKYAQAALKHSLEHIFERHSVIDGKTLKREALHFGMGKINPEILSQTINKNKELLYKNTPTQTLYTTKEVWQEEMKMVDFVKSGQNNNQALAPKAKISQDLDFLNQAQKDAIKHIWKSKDRVMAIQGAAGTGKTTLMKEAISGLQKNNIKVFTFAPSAQASRGVLRAEGFQDADTVASLLIDKNKQEQIKDSLIWIDEAGLLGSKTMQNVLKIAKEQNARVVLSGDTRQHKSVERGDAFSLLIKEAGLSPAQISEVVRQRGKYKEAVETISQGDISKGFKQLDNLGAIVETQDKEQRINTLVKSYLSTVKKGESGLIVSPTHQEKNEVTQALRHALKDWGKIKGKENNFKNLESLHFTTAERKDPLSYQAGQVLEFYKQSQNKAFKRGQRLVVIANSKNSLLTMDKFGQKYELDLDKEADKFSVYKISNLNLAKGDIIRITKNGKISGMPEIDDKSKAKTRQINNGSNYEVAGFTKTGDIKLTNGFVIPKNYAHLNYGYASTSHSAQGKTVDHVLVAESSSSFKAASMEQFYVSISRARKSVTVLTDDKAALLRAIGVEKSKESALELIPPKREQSLWDRILPLSNSFSAAEKSKKKNKEKGRDR